VFLLPGYNLLIKFIETVCLLNKYFSWPIIMQV
jgi:hypothetical protein